MTLTKMDIIQKVADECGFSKLEASEYVELLFDVIKDALEKGENVRISGFGNFVLRDKRQRVGRNPQTGQSIQIAPRRIMSFKISQILKEAMNAGLFDSGSSKADRDPDERI
jgi:integration host factor subunit alpha